MFMGGEAGDLALVLGDCCSHGTPMWWLCWQYFARFYLRRNMRTHLKKHSEEKSNKCNQCNGGPPCGGFAGNILLDFI